MKLLDPTAKTNWKYLAIVAVLGVVVGWTVVWLGAYSDLPDTRGQPKSKLQEGRFPIQPEEQTCTGDVDCVAVYADCSYCRCTAVSKQYEQKYQRELLCQSYQGRLCDYDCFPSRQISKCINNRCVLSPDSSLIDTSTWLTYRNEEFGFEVRYPQYYEGSDETKLMKEAGFVYEVGDFYYTLGIEIFEDHFKNFKILTPGGDEYRFDTKQKSWLSNKYQGEGKWEWIPVSELPKEERSFAPQKVEDLRIEAYTYAVGDGLCVGQVAILPHPSRSFVVRLSNFQCLNDVGIDNPKGGSFRLDTKEILSTFRFVE